MSLRDLFISIGVDADLNQLDKMDKGLDNIKSGAMVAGAAIAGLGFAVGSAFKSVISAGGEMEQAQVAFQTMFGSIEAGNKIVKEIEDFALVTPFSLSQVEQGIRLLKAYNIESENLFSTFSNLGNIAAGLNVDLTRLATVYGQVKAKGFLDAQDMRQFTEAGVGLPKMLSEITGYSQAMIAKSPKELGITFENVAEALEKMTGPGGQFADLMEKQSQTLPGLISNLGVMAVIIKRDIGKQVNEVIKPYTVELFKQLQLNRKIVSSTLGKWMSKIASVALTVIKNFGGIVKIAKVATATLGILTGSAILYGLGKIAIGLSQVGVAGFAAFAKTFAIGLVFAGAISALILLIDELWMTFTDPKADTYLRDIVNALKEDFPEAVKIAGKTFDMVFGSIFTIINKITGRIRAFLGSIISITTGDDTYLKSALQFLDQNDKSFKATTNDVFNIIPSSNSSSSNISVNVGDINVNNPSSSLDVKSAIIDSFTNVGLNMQLKAKGIR